MARALLLLLLLLACARLGPRPARCQEAPQTPDWRMTLKTIRNGVHKIDVYLNAALDLLGGEDGLCQYKCSDGEEAGGGAAGGAAETPPARGDPCPRPPPSPPGSLQAARPGRGCGGWRRAAALPGKRGAASGETSGTSCYTRVCVSVEICNLPEPTPAAAEGCQAGGAPERGGGGGLDSFAISALGAPRNGRVA